MGLDASYAPEFRFGWLLPVEWSYCERYGTAFLGSLLYEKSTGRIEEPGGMIQGKLRPHDWDFFHQRWKRFLSKQGVHESVTDQIHSELGIEQHSMKKRTQRRMLH